MIIDYYTLKGTWGIDELYRLALLDAQVASEPELQNKVDEALAQTEEEFLGLVGYELDDPIPKYILSAGKGIIPALFKWHLLPSEENQIIYETLMKQLQATIKIRGIDIIVDPPVDPTGEVYDIGIFVV